MIKKPKLWLILAALLMVVGLVIFTVAMSKYRWDFTQLNANPFENNTYELNGAFQSIALESDTANVTIVPTNKGTATVVCYEPDNQKHTVEITDGCLSITENDTRKWHERIGISFGSPQITIYLPDSAYTSLTMDIHTGNVQIDEAFTFSSMDIQTTTGHIENYASTSGVMKIKTSTGAIDIEKVSAAVMDLAVSTGKITVTDTTCENLTSTGDTGDITLKNVIAAESIQIERSTGDITFDGADAADILVKTDTGDVTGTLLTDKVFDVETDTGSVNIPKSGNGGNCVIYTDTGDIKLTVG